MDDATLNSSDAAAAAMMNRRLLEQLMIMMAIHSLHLHQEGGANDDAQSQELQQMMMEYIMAMNGRDQSAVSISKEILLAAVTQRLLDAQLRLLLDGGEKGRGSASDQQQLMDRVAAKKKKRVAAAAKKKRNKWNKVAAKHKGTKFMR